MTPISVSDGSFDFCNKCPGHKNCCVRGHREGLGEIETPLILPLEAQTIAAKTGLALSTFSVPTKSGSENQSLAIKSTNNRCFFNMNARCTIYAARPLDCRIFPFDIIENDRNEFWWIVYTQLCPVKFDHEKYFASAKRVLSDASLTTDEMHQFASHGATAMHEHSYALLEQVRVESRK